MNPATQEFDEHVADFQRDYLSRSVIFLAVTVWLIGVGVLFVRFSLGALASIILWEGLAWCVYRLCERNRLRLAANLLIGGLGAWVLGVMWLARDPALAVLLVLIGPVAAALLEPRQAATWLALALVGGLVLTRALFPGQWLSWQSLMVPLAAIIATVLSLIWGINLSTILAWAQHSTRQALNRLAEVQEHRARLGRSMKDLDDAYHRLERANEMLVAARADAEQARQARNQLTLTVSHELRTPLNFIIGFSELMVNAPDTYGDLSGWPPGLYDDIREIYHNSNHLLRLVNDILDLGRAEAHQLSVVKEWVAPAQILEEAEGIMRPAVAQRHLALDVEIAPDLPSLFVDRTRIRQVLINLVSNSLRFTQQGSIRLAVRREGDEVVFSVQDTGTGIPPEEVPKVFEEFGQAQASVWRRRDGSGLGVPISRRFVEMHGGRMWLDSQVGLGTTFSFALPGIATEPEPPPELETGAYWRFVAEQNVAPRLLLLLSPDPGAAELLAGCVAGYRVVSSSQVSTARQQLLNLLPQALIVDEAIAADPEVQAWLRTLPYDLPAIVFRLPGASLHAHTLPKGVSGYLIKPILHEDLLRALRGLDPSAVKGESSVSPGSLHSLRSLLVIDDDPAMARFVSLVLAADGHESIALEAVTTGADALGRIQCTPPGADAPLPDAVLLDLGLPDLSGWDVLAALQAASGWRRVPVILVTAASLPEEIESRERKVLQLSTFRPLSADELGLALDGLLQAIRPTFPTNGSVPVRPADPSV